MGSLVLKCLLLSIVVSLSRVASFSSPGRHQDCRAASLLSHSKTTSDNDSLSYLVSSRNRYAQALGLNDPEEIDRVKEDRRNAATQLQNDMSVTLDPQKRQYLSASYRYHYGQHPFVCQSCWSYRPICKCSTLPTEKVPTPFARIIVWTHADEWGSPSNTGCLLPLLLEDTDIWMRGYHDHQLESLIKHHENSLLLLWPNNNQHHDSSQHHKQEKNHPTMGTHVWWPDGRAICYKSESSITTRRPVLIVLEGTWRQARRLLSKFDDSIPRLAVASNDSSLIAPLRCHNSPDSLCTAQAVVEACRAVEATLDSPTTVTHCISNRWSCVLERVRHKIELTRRYQGKPVVTSL